MPKPPFLNYYSKTKDCFKKEYFDVPKVKNDSICESNFSKLSKNFFGIFNCEYKDPQNIKNLILNKKIHNFLFKTNLIRFHQIISSLSSKKKLENFDNCFLNSILKIYYRELNQKKVKNFLFKSFHCFLVEKKKIPILIRQTAKFTLRLNKICSKIFPCCPIFNINQDCKFIGDLSTNQKRNVKKKYRKSLKRNLISSNNLEIQLTQLCYQVWKFMKTKIKFKIILSEFIINRSKNKVYILFEKNKLKHSSHNSYFFGCPTVSRINQQVTEQRVM